MKKWKKMGIAAVLITCACPMLILVINDYIARHKAFARIQTLPAATFVSLHGYLVCLTDFDCDKPLLIRYFHPGCGFCQYEAQEMVSNSEAYSMVQVIMITPDDSLQRIHGFISDNNLYEIDNIEFLTDRDDHFRKTFGNATIPSSYIYCPGHQLVRKFQGEAQPGVIHGIIHTLTTSAAN